MNDKNIKRSVARAVILVAILLGLASLYLLFSENGKNIVRSGTAVIVSAWHDAISGDSGEPISEEIDFAGSSSPIEEKYSPPARSKELFVIKKSKESSVVSSVVVLSSSTLPASAPNVSTGMSVVEKSFGAKAMGEASNTASASTIIPAAIVATSSNIFNSPCTFSETGTPTQKIIFNEIAWMGLPAGAGESAFDAGKNEWMEIKNISGSDIDMFGWTILDVSGKIKINFSDHDLLGAGRFFLLARASSTLSFVPQKFYSGDLVNAGDDLVLFDPACNLVDVIRASGGWSGGNNSTKQTLERNADVGGWHTSALAGGTPGAENSASPSSLLASSSLATSSVAISSVTSSKMFDVAIAFAGDGAGTVKGINGTLGCNAFCKGSYAEGTVLALTPVAGAEAVFGGWSDPCFGETNCSFTVTNPVFLTATFRSNIAPPLAPLPLPTPVAPAPTPIPPDATPPADPVSSTSQPDLLHLLVAAVQIGGASSTNDFVKIYNPTAEAVDISGWKLRKKSQAGTDASLRVFPSGSSIATGQYFTWANSSGGFSQAVGANVASTEILSANNSVALLNASGTIVDAVAWGEGSNQYVEGSAYSTNPDANQILQRQSTDGVMVDADNNATDFTLANS